MWKGRDAVSLVSSQPRYSRLGWRTHNTPKINVCVCVRVQLCSVPLVWMGPGGSPFQACYLLLNKSAAGDRTQSVDGQRARESQGKGAYCYPLWRGGGGG